MEEDDAAINRYGFNSLGHGHALAQLRARVLLFSQEHPELFPSPSSSTSVPLPPPSLPRSLRPGHILAVNLGKNKTSPADSNEDYVKGVRMLGPYADVVVINVSSPNTPGLRALQGKEVLENLLKDVVKERNRISGGTGLPKIAVKVACDLNEEELGDVAGAVRGSGVEGVIVSNTTVRREGLGLTSGMPISLRERYSLLTHIISEPIASGRIIWSTPIPPIVDRAQDPSTVTTTLDPHHRLWRHLVRI